MISTHGNEFLSKPKIQGILIIICMLVALPIMIYSIYDSNREEVWIKNDITSAKDSIDLVLIVSVDKPYAAVGYGSVYGCRIDKIVKGSIQDTNISITILVGQEDKEKLFSAVLMKPKQLEIGFIKHGTNEEYSLIPINGFVDKSKTSWRIVYIESLD